MKFLFILLLFVSLFACSPTSSPDETNGGIEGVYKITKITEECHEGDVVIVDYDYWRVGIPTTIYRIAPDGTLVESVVLENVFSGHARILKNGNYLTAAVNQGIVEFTKEGEIVRTLEQPGVSHQAVPLDNGNLLLVYCGRSMFREIAWDGVVVFEWKAEENIRPYSDPEDYVGMGLVPNQAELIKNIYLEYNDIEWTHLNFAQKLPNGNYITSLRNQDLVVEVDGKTGEIVWTWGALILKHQHTPYVHGDYMYVFDNGNGRVIQVDRNTGRITWEFNDILAPTLGDCRILPNGNILITDAFNRRVIEVTIPDGEIVWELQTEFILYRVWAEGTW